MKIGMVCPYSFDVPGGVQAHVVELAQVLIERGHSVSVLAPVGRHVDVADFVVSAGRAVGIPYNGSVARLAFGPRQYSLVRRWIAEGEFDVLHIHEPAAPSVSMLALMLAEGPIVATFHTSTTRSYALSAVQPVLRPQLEKIAGRIAVSELARRWQVEALGSDAVEIPNGVNVSAFANAPLLSDYPYPGKTVLFLGRFDEPRKGIQVLLSALPDLVARYPDIRILIAGRGNRKRLRSEAGEFASHLKFLGQVSDAEKASALRSVDVYCAPNTSGESFGIVLVEAMAAGTPVVASELDAFRRVLRDGEAGVLVPINDAVALAVAIGDLLDSDSRRTQLIDEGTRTVLQYDWPVVAEQIVRVYETVTVGTATVRVEA